MDNSFDYGSFMASRTDHVLHFWGIRTYSIGDSYSSDTCQADPGKGST